MGLRVLERDSTAAKFGFEERTAGIAGAIQRPINGHWLYGLAFSFEKSTIDIEDLAENDGDRLQGALVFKGLSGGTSIETSLGGGTAGYEASCHVDLPMDGTRAIGDQDITFYSGHLRLIHTIFRGGHYCNPVRD